MEFSPVGDPSPPMNIKDAPTSPRRGCTAGTAARFKPAWWLRNPHLQTLWPVLLRRRSRIDLTTERLELPDGDFIDLAWAPSRSTPSRSTHAPIVLLLHGLEGSMDSHYIGGLMEALLGAGWRSVLMHFRGCSGEPNRLARRYHSGETGDLAYVAKTLRARNPDAPMCAVGFSLGGNVLLKWLGETGAANPLTAAVAVSVPFQLDRSVTMLGQGFARVYERYLLRQLLRSTRRKFAGRDWGVVDPVALANVRTLWQFDDLITAPLHGFRDARDYYQQSSSRRFLASIAVPTLVMHALDDPFLPRDCVPSAADVSSAVTLEISQQGGHVGFIGGPWPWRPNYHLEQRIPEYLAEHCPEFSVRQ